MQPTTTVSRYTASRGRPAGLDWTRLDRQQSLLRLVTSTPFSFTDNSLPGAWVRFPAGKKNSRTQTPFMVSEAVYLLTLPGGRPAAPYYLPSMIPDTKMVLGGRACGVVDRLLGIGHALRQAGDRRRVVSTRRGRPNSFVGLPRLATSTPISVTHNFVKRGSSPGSCAKTQQTSRRTVRPEGPLERCYRLRKGVEVTGHWRSKWFATSVPSGRATNRG